MNADERIIDTLVMKGSVMAVKTQEDVGTRLIGDKIIPIVTGNLVPMRPGRYYISLNMTLAAEEALSMNYLYTPEDVQQAVAKDMLVYDCCVSTTLGELKQYLIDSVPGRLWTVKGDIRFSTGSKLRRSDNEGT